jgi:hypothetical protein
MEISTLYLHDQGPFYDIVNSYFLAVYGVGAVYKSTSPLLENGKCYLNCKAIEGPFYQHNNEIFALRDSTDRQKVVYELGGMLVNLACERVKTLGPSRHPTILFLRHVRNAVSHRNVFFFESWEPRFPAFWRKLIIPDSPKGAHNSLYGQKCLGEFIYSGDLPCLLYDVEQIILKQWLAKNVSTKTNNSQEA